MRCNDMVSRICHSKAILQRETQCKRKHILMISQYLPYDFALNQVKCKNNDHIYLFHCINTYQLSFILTAALPDKVF